MTTCQPLPAWATSRVCQPLSGRHSASFCRSNSSRVIDFSSGFYGVVGAVERQHGWLAVDQRLEVHRAPPDVLYVSQRIRSVVQTQFHPVELVDEEEFSTIAVISVDYVDPRLPEVGQAEQEPLLDLLELAGINVVYPSLLLVGIGEHLILVTEFRRQESIDEGYIVMDSAHLEDFFSPEASLLVPVSPLLQIIALLVLLAEASRVPAVLDVAEQLDPQLVGVDAWTVHGERAAVVVGVVDHLGGAHRLGRHDLRVPVAIVV